MCFRLGVVSFLQGITGWGSGCSWSTILIGIGVRQYNIFTNLASSRHGNTFGTLGATWDALADSARSAPWYF